MTGFPTASHTKEIKVVLPLPVFLANLTIIYICKRFIKETITIAIHYNQKFVFLVKYECDNRGGNVSLQNVLRKADGLLSVIDRRTFPTAASLKYTLYLFIENLETEFIRKKD